MIKNIFEKSSSLTKRLRTLLLVCFVPLTVMIIYLMVMLNQFSERYDQIVSNITKTNEYNISFKEDLDYTMYIIVVNSERAEELVDTEQPRKLIGGARTVFQELYEEAGDRQARNHLQRILKTLNSLEDSVKEIENDARTTGMYDKNMERLELNVRIQTELIQEQIQNYIYYEASNLEALREEIRSDVVRAIILSVILFLVILTGALLISRNITANITGGIRQLRSVTKKAGKGDFSVRARLEESDEEMQELGDGFNQMVEKIGNLVEGIRVEQLNLRMTEQKLLQAQINPHFLYNTMDTIIWLAEDNQNEQVIMMVTALSDFFRTTLSRGKDYITVEEEESHIRSYLQIQQFRYQDILEYEIDIPPELYRYQILKLTLQPLVENALYHGIKNKRGKGRILVSGEEKDGKLIFSVTDNGMGMTPERLKQIRKEMNQDIRGTAEPAGFGLYNVAQRIRLNYGTDYDIWVESVYGVGTEFTVTIPAIKNS
ncbi:MAG: histidine kinase [Candidatus Choladocola sp.]|nr:histidine kinase [Candidatus Choladocola sp.]